MTELEKYVGIYSDAARYATYGHTNHGKLALPILEKWSFSSLVDVGCGHNEFKGCLLELMPSIRAIGVDFACPSADVCAPANVLPFFDDAFDVVTAFDVLEHLPMSEVKESLREMRRVSKAFVFSISYVPSVRTFEGRNLHPTVRPEAWWRERIAEAGAIDLQKVGRYLVGRWAGKRDITSNLPISKDGSCILVGNGPSVSRRPMGKVIDAFEEVIRFNRFKLDPEYSGARTTVWSTFGRGTIPQTDFKPQKIVFIHEKGTPALKGERLWRVPRSTFDALNADLRRFTQRPKDDKFFPSSGLTVAYWLLSSGVGQIHLVGFDHFSKAETGKHHYWDQRSFGRPREHDGDAEAAFMAEYVKARRVFYLA